MSSYSNIILQLKPPEITVPLIERRDYVRSLCQLRKEMNLELPEEILGRWSRGLYFILKTLGILVPVADATTGAYALLSLIPHIASWIAILVASALAFLATIVYLAFEIDQVQDNLQIDAANWKLLDDMLWAEGDALLAIVREVGKINSQHSLTKDELERLNQYIAAFNEKSTEKQKISVLLPITRVLISVLTGVFFFSGGYFLADPFLQAVSSMTGLPVLDEYAIPLGVLLGLLSLGVYIFCQQPKVDNLVGRFFGVDEDKQKLCKKQLTELNGYELVAKADSETQYCESDFTAPIPA